LAINKRAGFGLEVKSLVGKSGMSYIVFKTKNGAFHVFQEVEAKNAAKDCGVQTTGRNTRQAWEEIWKAK
jgi:hypothetical protein